MKATMISISNNNISDTMESFDRCSIDVWFLYAIDKRTRPYVCVNAYVRTRKNLHNKRNFIEAIAQIHQITNIKHTHTILNQYITFVHE